MANIIHYKIRIMVYDPNDYYNRHVVIVEGEEYYILNKLEEVEQDLESYQMSDVLSVDRYLIDSSANIIQFENLYNHLSGKNISMDECMTMFEN